MAENTGNNNNSATDSISAVVKGAGASKAGKALLGKAAGHMGHWRSVRGKTVKPSLPSSAPCCSF